MTIYVSESSSPIRVLNVTKEMAVDPDAKTIAERLMIEPTANNKAALIIILKRLQRSCSYSNPGI